MKTKNSVYWKIHTVNLLREIVECNPGMGVMHQPINILGRVLYALADRAREINDPELNSLMCRLTLFSQSDPTSQDFDERTVKLVHEWDEKLIERISK